jgi:predicted RNase H-like HicB family nuclease
MNEHPTFTITLYWSEEQGAYVGQVEELVGVASSGSTYEEALASTLEAIRWWQEMTTRQPRPPAQPEQQS